jgi:hypothetical protein
LALPRRTALVVAAVAALGFAVPPARPGRPCARSAIGPRRRRGAALLSARPRPTRVAVAATLVLLTGAELISRNAASALNAEPAGRYAVFQELPPEQLQGLQLLKRELAGATPAASARA